MISLFSSPIIWQARSWFPWKTWRRSGRGRRHSKESEGKPSPAQGQATLEDLKTILERIKGTVVESYPSLGIYEIRVPEGADVPVIAQAVTELRGVEKAEPNYGDFVSLYAPGFADLPVGYRGDPGPYGGTSISAAFAANVIANMLYWKPDATRQDVLQALGTRP